MFPIAPLGHALLENGDDFSRHNEIHRWWGGARLTNTNLWRWDASSGKLIPPR
jgi:hypothetical protein